MKKESISGRIVYTNYFNEKMLIDKEKIVLDIKKGGFWDLKPVNTGSYPVYKETASGHMPPGEYVRKFEDIGEAGILTHTFGPFLYIWEIKKTGEKESDIFYDGPDNKLLRFYISDRPGNERYHTNELLASDEAELSELEKTLCLMAARNWEKQKTHLSYKKAILMYRKYSLHEDVSRIESKMQKKVKVDQTVVHGDQVTKTEIKDSVLNRSNVGSGGGSSKAKELREAKALLDEGVIDDDEFKQMKKEILGK